MMDTTVYNYHKSLYIPETQELVFHIPHVQKLGKNHCGDSRLNEFKRREPFQYLLCRCDYAEIVDASFVHHLIRTVWGKLATTLSA